ncbi:MAG TPA: hypothetical protein VGI66_13420, partial [Streptosporangiaceae bacterium]
MSAQQIDDTAGDSPPRRWSWSRWRWYFTGAFVTLLAVGAFLLWGPIGIGNGPLSMGLWGGQSNDDQGMGPVGTIIPIFNRGDSSAVIDAVQLVNATNYPAPHLIALELLTSGKCGGAWPARATGHGFVIVGCGGTDAGPVVGHAFAPTHGIVFGYPATAFLGAPKPGGCWVLTGVIVHYHVGIRHYVGTYPD